MKNYRGWPCEVYDTNKQEWVACKFVSLCLSPMPEPIVQIEGRMPWFATWGSVRGLPDRKELEAYFKQDETPSNRWSQSGQAEPHHSLYNCERAELTMGDYTDDELANAAFLNYDRQPSVADIMSGKAHMPIVYMTAIKERVRWLSRALTKVEAELQVTKRFAMASTRGAQREILSELDKLNEKVVAKPRTMQIRMHRGTLSGSLHTRDEVPATICGIIGYLRKYAEGSTPSETELASVYTDLYSDEFDTRICWSKTYIVMYKGDDGGNYPIAFTNQPLES